MARDNGWELLTIRDNGWSWLITSPGSVRKYEKPPIQKTKTFSQETTIVGGTPFMNIPIHDRWELKTQSNTLRVTCSWNSGSVLSVPKLNMASGNPQVYRFGCSILWKISVMMLDNSREPITISSLWVLSLPWKSQPCHEVGTFVARLTTCQAN